MPTPDEEEASAASESVEGGGEEADCLAVATEADIRRLLVPAADGYVTSEELFSTPAVPEELRVGEAHLVPKMPIASTPAGREFAAKVAADVTHAIIPYKPRDGAAGPVSVGSQKRRGHSGQSRIPGG